MPLGSKICCQNHLRHILSDLLFMRREENELKVWARGKIGNCCCCSFQSAFPDPPLHCFKQKRQHQALALSSSFISCFVFPPPWVFGRHVCVTERHPRELATFGGLLSILGFLARDLGKYIQSPGLENFLKNPNSDSVVTAQGSLGLIFTGSDC